jgi:hypothetical protein
MKTLKSPLIALIAVVVSTQASTAMRSAEFIQNDRTTINYVPNIKVGTTMQCFVNRWPIDCDQAIRRPGKVFDIRLKK